MKDVKITVCRGRGGGGGQYEVALQVDESVTSGDVVRSLLHSLDLPQEQQRVGGKGGAWRLVECWRSWEGCKGSVPS